MLGNSRMGFEPGNSRCRIPFTFFFFYSKALCSFFRKSGGNPWTEFPRKQYHVIFSLCWIPPKGENTLKWVTNNQYTGYEMKYFWNHDWMTKLLTNKYTSQYIYLNTSLSKLFQIKLFGNKYEKSAVCLLIQCQLFVYKQGMSAACLHLSYLPRLHDSV